MRRIAHRLLEFFLALAQRLREDRGFETAGSLTFTTLLALVPLVAVALALATPFPAYEHAMAALGRFAERQLLPAGSAMVTRQIAEFAERAGALTSVGLAFILVTSVMLMHTVEEALNRKVPDWAKRRAHHWLILHGRYTCKARRPDCPACIVRDLCRYKAKTVAEAPPKLNSRAPDAGARPRSAPSRRRA